MSFGTELLPWDIEKRQPVVKAKCVEPSAWKQRRPASARPASGKRPPRPASAAPSRNTRAALATVRQETSRRPPPWNPSGKPKAVGRHESLQDRPKWCLDPQDKEGLEDIKQRKERARKVTRPRTATRRKARSPRKRCQSAGALRSTVHEYSPDVMFRGAGAGADHAASSMRSAASWMDGKEEIARLAQSTGASIVPEYTPRGTFSMRLIFDQGGFAADNTQFSAAPELSAAASSALDPSLGGTVKLPESSPLLREETIAEEEGYSSDEFEPSTPQISSPQPGSDPVGEIVRRALEGVHVAVVEDEEPEPVMDMQVMRQSLKSQSGAKTPLVGERPTDQSPQDVAPIDNAAPVFEEQSGRHQQAMKLANEEGMDPRLALMLSTDTGKQAFVYENDQWVEGDGDFGDAAVDGPAVAKASPLAVMQLKEMARFKDLGATRGQFRCPETSWPTEVNDLRAKMGDHRRQQCAEVISNADEWQKRFEAENDQCHELALELEALKAQLVEPPTQSNNCIRFQPLLGGNESFSPKIETPVQYAQANAEMAHPKSAASTKALKSGRTMRRKPTQAAQHRAGEIPPARLSSQVKKALANGFKFNEQGDWEKALIQFEQVISMDPSSSSAWYGKGFSFYLRGDHSLSTEAYSHALKLDPESHSQFMQRGP